MSRNLDDIRDALIGLGADLVSLEDLPNGDMAFAIAPDGVDRTIAVPSTVGALGHEFLDAVIGDVHHYVVRPLPELAGTTVRAFHRAAMAAIAGADWLIVDPIVPVLLAEIGEPARMADPKADGMRAVRHVVRIARLARQAVDAGLLETGADGDGTTLLTDPVGWQYGASSLNLAA